jgi:hypothetical protein
MYDMYPWDSASQGDYPPGPLRSRRNSSPKTPAETSQAQAVQVALDRRDNGGDAVPVAGPPAARPTAGRTGQ